MQTLIYFSIQSDLWRFWPAFADIWMRNEKFITHRRERREKKRKQYVSSILLRTGSQTEISLIIEDREKSFFSLSRWTFNGGIICKFHWQRFRDFSDFVKPEGFLENYMSFLVPVKLSKSFLCYQKSSERCHGLYDTFWRNLLKIFKSYEVPNFKGFSKFPESSENFSGSIKLFESSADCETPRRVFRFCEPTEDIILGFYKLFQDFASYTKLFKVLLGARDF